MEQSYGNLPAATESGIKGNSQNKEDHSLNPHGNQIPANHICGEGVTVHIDVKALVDSRAHLIIDEAN